jgi:hypothetical protein
MVRFSSAYAAKEFLIARIVEEAAREGISLSEVERKMLYFSGTSWRPLNIIDAIDEFEGYYNQQEYEDKIAALIRNARKRAHEVKNKQELRAWSDAIRVLSEGNHYLLVMLGQTRSSRRRRGEVMRLWGTAFGIVCGAVLLICLAHRLGIEPRRESVLSAAWVIVACAAGAYLAFRLLAGRKRTEELVERLLGLFGGAE